MTESQIAGLVAIAAGAFGITAALCDWDWFMNSRKAQAWVKRIGRRNARGMYACIGAFVALFGLFMVVSAPGGSDATTTAQSDNAASDNHPQNSRHSVTANPPPAPPKIYESAPDAFNKQFTTQTDPNATNTPASANPPSTSKPASRTNRPIDTASNPSRPPGVASNPPRRTPEISIGEIPDNGIDLLPRIEPERDQLLAKWSRQGGHLISPIARPAILQVPVELPESYTVVAVVEELEVDGNGSFSLGVNVAGSGVSVVVAGTKGDTSGLQLVDNKITRVNPTYRRGPAMKPGRNQIVCTVNQNRVQVRCDDEVIVDWNGDPSRLSYGFEARKGRQDQLKVGSWLASFRISQLTLIPQSN